MKTLKFLRNVHLSPAFGGIAHNDTKGKCKDIPAGTLMKITNEELADHLIKLGLAQPLEVEPEQKDAKKSKADSSSAL